MDPQFRGRFIVIDPGFMTIVSNLNTYVLKNIEFTA